MDAQFMVESQRLFGDATEVQPETVVALDQLAEASAAAYRIRVGHEGQIVKRYEEWVATRADDEESSE